MSASSEINADFPAKLKPLFRPHRYKVLRGGRGGAKSWGIARALLILGASRKLRILCTREVQKSIRDSVHKLLCDQIQSLGYGTFYEPQQTVIRGLNGTEFIFAGLSDQTAESVKSFEGVDIVWVEEAQAVSDQSWMILIPTIRKDGSEIWVSFNPELDTDPTWVRFVENTPPDAVVIEMSYRDNPWFPEVLEKERQHALATLPKAEYDNIWEGKTRPAAKGAIYAAEIADAQTDKRIGNVPYDPLLKVHVVFDLGWNDAMAISLVQRSTSEIRVIEYLEDTHKTLDYYSGVLREKRMNWGQVWLPHDGVAKDYKSGKSAQEIMLALGWDVRIVPKMDVESGIKLARMTFPRCYFHKAKTERLVACLKNYRRHISQTTNEPSQPLHDAYSHGADNFRYLCISADHMSNDDWGQEDEFHDQTGRNPIGGY